MQREIMRQIHERGHFAASNTEELVRQEVHIAGLRQNVESVCTNCVECFLYNRKQGKAERFLNLIDRPLEINHIGHMGPLPLTNKKY